MARMRYDKGSVRPGFKTGSGVVVQSRRQCLVTSRQDASSNRGYGMVVRSRFDEIGERRIIEGGRSTEAQTEGDGEKFFRVTFVSSQTSSSLRLGLVQ